MWLLCHVINFDLRRYHRPGEVVGHGNRCSYAHESAVFVVKNLVPEDSLYIQIT